MNVSRAIIPSTPLVDHTSTSAEDDADLDSHEEQRIRLEGDEQWEALSPLDAHSQVRDLYRQARQNAAPASELLPLDPVERRALRDRQHLEREQLREAAAEAREQQKRDEEAVQQKQAEAARRQRVVMDELAADPVQRDIHMALHAVLPEVIP